MIWSNYYIPPLTDPKSQKLLKKLKNKKISLYDLEDMYFVTRDGYNVNSDNIFKLIDDNIVSFKEIVDRIKSMDEFDKFFHDKILTESNKLTKEDLRYIFDKIDHFKELAEFNHNYSLLQYVIDTDIVTFKELVDKYKSIKKKDNHKEDPCLWFLLHSTKNFKWLVEDSKITESDLKYMLNKIDSAYELKSLVHNPILLRHILNEFLLDKELLHKFNEILKNWKRGIENNIYNIFDYMDVSIPICRSNKDIDEEEQKELQSLKEVNKYLCSFNEEQRLTLSKAVKNNDKAFDILRSVVESHLEDQYSFEALKSILTKDSKKQLKTKFNF